MQTRQKGKSPSTSANHLFSIIGFSFVSTPSLRGYGAEEIPRRVLLLDGEGSTWVVTVGKKSGAVELLQPWTCNNSVATARALKVLVEKVDEFWSAGFIKKRRR